jgi:hypothetical protein
METVEVVVYMGIALIVGSLLIAFIGGWDAQGTLKGLRTLFSPEPDDSYEQITSAELPSTVLGTWDACGMGTTALNKTIYVEDSTPLNKSLIFDRVKQANLCRTLQWSAGGCGTRDDISFPDTAGPTVLVLRCDPATRTLIISQ